MNVLEEITGQEVRHIVLIHECDIQSAPRGRLFSFSIEAENAELAWVEASPDQLNWERISRYQRRHL